MSDLLIQNGTVLTMAPDEEVVSGGAVAIRDGRIAAIGKPADLKRMGFGEGKTLNARGQVILPGLVNPHVHATGVLLKAVPKASSARSARPRLPRLLFAEADASETEVLARASFLEALKSGVTTLGLLDRHARGLVNAIHESGLRAVLAEALMEADMVSTESGSPPQLDAKTGAARLDAALEWMDALSADGSGRLTSLLGINSPGLCSDETLECAAKEAEARKLGLHYHLAVFSGETEALRARSGGDLVGFLRRLGLLRPDTLLAGGSVLKEEEMAGLRDSAAQLAIVPRGDAGRGIRIPAAALVRGKIPLVLATNGIGHDLFAAMRAFLLTVRLDAESATIVRPEDALQMATRDGARALRLLGSVGSIEIGKKADLICVTLDPARSSLLETEDPAAMVVEICGPGDVTDVIVDGEVVMEGGKVRTLDEKAVLTEARKVAAAIWKRVLV